ncbi:TldD/PmbA family protein [Oecophyllibacter saccharovorans]|uniref:TldD/PmbA family protein n=1 Tax=Oecophyllibacter saccharovorans TaxID=2558360 RepID=A0A506UQ01_9PROT|nr:TldD/PmbA family protein [Oecophyllibacter saccharovorans]TPW35471.1 TldD/PmbA family protein [Oecophyllibacter saccharovorans]
MTPSDPSSLQPLLEQALQLARQQGADQADAVVTRSRDHSALVREGRPEEREHAENVGLGLRVFRNGRMACVSSTDLSRNALEQLAERACAMADAVPPSPFDGLAEHPLAQPDRQLIEQLDLVDPSAPPSMEQLIETACAMEEAALSSKGITNSSGASASAQYQEIALATTGGFSGAYARTRFGRGVSVVAGTGNAMERDYATHSTTHQADLRSAAELGTEAAERALARLNPTRPTTGTMPVIFDRRVSNSLLGHLASAINGATIARGASFLRDRRGQRLFREGIRITDSPRLARGPGSRPFDGEGCAATELAVIDDGVLEHWLLDSRTARQLGLTSNGRAVRSSSAPPRPGTSNFIMQPGTLTPQALRADISEGLLVTELMGNAINLLTGDYSRGAAGFMIRNGQIAEPVSGVTLAGDLAAMFASLTAADDLTYDRAHAAPSVRIDSMTIAGT